MWRLSSSASSKRSSSPNSSSALRRSSSRPNPSGSALAEVLRKNPFRSGSKELLAGPEEDDDSTKTTAAVTKSLNKDLWTLAEFFPDVKVDVLRELLLRFDGESRLPICTEQLLKYKAEWARGRMSIPPRERDEPIPLEEQFRTRAYIAGVRKTLSLEFHGLSRSAIEAVLAEVNFSYRHARPILQGLANKSWRVAFSNIFKRKPPANEAPAVLFEKSRVGLERARLAATGSAELDRELEALFLGPAQHRSAQDQESEDRELAQALNLAEAEKADALFECQVCYNDVTFEDISTCTHATPHVICLDCVRRALHEALFGQGWATSVDIRMGTLKCLAPSDTATTDDGHIPQDLVKRAVCEDKAGQETWGKFEERLVDDALYKSALPVVRCPFCSYAEADRVYDPDHASQLRWRIRNPSNSSATTSITKILTVILLVECLPSLFLLLIPALLLFPSRVKDVFYTAIAHLALKQRTTRFVCRHPSCSRMSCLKCLKAWHDPHTCHEPLIISLRTTVEAARTAAVKRTCPRCGTSFVKSSGCNKLTCVCGYAMCYLCRKNIGKAGANEGAEGYRHFCEHFRPNPGQKCTECDKCDLYRPEDEDWVVRRAGEEAERLWREREGMVGVKGLEEATGNVAGEDTVWRKFWYGKWTVQGCVDWIVERTVVVDVE